MYGTEKLLNDLSIDKDTLLILTLTCLLYKQNADKILITALIYILIG